VAVQHQHLTQLLRKEKLLSTTGFKPHFTSECSTIGNCCQLPVVCSGSPNTEFADEEGRPAGVKQLRCRAASPPMNTILQGSSSSSSREVDGELNCAFQEAQRLNASATEAKLGFSIRLQA
jgi:hypothetical protein